MKFKKEWLIGLIDEDETPLVMIEEGNWQDDGKYSSIEYIFEYNGKFYSIDNYKTGSYYTDYTFGHESWEDEIECEEVEKVEVITYKWRTKK